MKQSINLLEKITLKTLAVGISLVQRGSTADTTGAKGKGLRYSTQFKYYIEVDQSADPMVVAAEVYRLVCRTNFAAPGFALLRQKDIKSSSEQRQSIAQLKENLSSLHRALLGQSIGWFSLNRFDQKSTTHPHRDAGPAQSLLILGYEPSTKKAIFGLATTQLARMS